MASQASGHGGNPRLAFPCPPQVHPHVLGWASWDTKKQPVIGTDHRRERHSRAGNMGDRKLPRACLSSLSGRVLEDSVNVARLERNSQTGWGGRGMPGLISWLPAQQLGWGRQGPGSVNPPHFLRGWPPHHKAKQLCPSSPHTARVGILFPGQPHDRFVLTLYCKAPG